MSSFVFQIDGKTVYANPDDVILTAAERSGIQIPRLCYKSGYRAEGNCRACMVEIDDEKLLAAACCRKPTENMVVRSKSERAVSSQKMVLELLTADVPEYNHKNSENELNFWSNYLGLEKRSRLPQRALTPIDNTNPAISVDLNSCIQCTRCVRACREEQNNDVIGYAFRGAKSKIIFDANTLLGSSTCVSCGECVQSCPTDALRSIRPQYSEEAKIEKKVSSACPYCGVGCLLTFNVSKNQIISVNGRDGPSNHSRLCVKGRYGFDYVHSPKRLREPLVRKDGAPKSLKIANVQDVLDFFTPVSWDEALDRAAEGFRTLLRKDGSGSLAGLGSAKGSNEEAYLFQKLIRTGFGTNNVDHCTRLCHASSVSAMLETIGSGGVSNQVADVKYADVILVIGARPTVNHPVAATFIKNEVRKGKKLILVDPYRSDLARYAQYFVQCRPDTDVPFLNSLMHTIITEELYDKNFVLNRTEDFEKLRNCVLDYPPEKVAPICGLDASTLKKIARVYATTGNSMIFWGMGISQHVHGTDNARCLISLALLCGQIGRKGCGLHPLRGQNNVQGASDMGLIPMVYPDYQPITDNLARTRFEKLWETSLNEEIGLTVVEMLQQTDAGGIKGMYVMGENPAMSDPNLEHARNALASLEHLVVQDIFFTETANFADVILPASAFAEKTGTFTNTDRRVQLGRKAVELPGQAQQDLWIIQSIASRMGLEWTYKGPSDVFEEIRTAVPSMAGISWERLEEEQSVTYPCVSTKDPGEQVLFKEKFPTPSGKARFIPADYTHAAELPDNEFPYVLITGRILEHWHTGSMTRKSSVLDALEPDAVISINPKDMAKNDISSGDFVTLESRRGKVEALVRSDENLLIGNVFMAFCYAEAAANFLTNEALDPFGKIPEFKYCAVKLRRR